MLKRKRLLLLGLIGGFFLYKISTILSVASASILNFASEQEIQKLGWVPNKDLFCGGTYTELRDPTSWTAQKKIKIISDQLLYTQDNTSVLTGHVQLAKGDQQLCASKAYLYRDPKTHQFSSIDLCGPVQWKEPYSLVLGCYAHYDLRTQAKRVTKVLYRTELYKGHLLGSKLGLEKTKQDTQEDIIAWGKADQFIQPQPFIFKFKQVMLSTCAPDAVTWQLQAKHLTLNKETGQGYAYHAWILIHHIPVFYMPYINFPIDKRRKTGFLWPVLGTSSRWGGYLQLPFYWNIAPAEDMLIIGRILSRQREVQWLDIWRYLTRTGGEGTVMMELLPRDKQFIRFKQAAAETYSTYTDAITQAELQRLLHASLMRYHLAWHHRSLLNTHWETQIHYDRVSDDYYLRDLGNINEGASPNQLLQEATLSYKSDHFSFIGRLQAYQTLHLLGDTLLLNQYRRFPQLIANVHSSNQDLGLNFFLNSEMTRFTILNNPGVHVPLPIGERLHVQPGISWLFSLPYLNINPRAKLAMTEYVLSHHRFAHHIRRVVPILEVNTDMLLSHPIKLLGRSFNQTLEPQVYYTYVPYRKQNNIPLFDTDMNTLNYDQLFIHNRFSGIDRIGDANQMSVGLATTLIDSSSGLQKARLSIGQILYFAKRRVTLCQDHACIDDPDCPENRRRVSSLISTLNYNMSPLWAATANLVWNPISKRTENSLLSLRYQPDHQHILMASYNFVRNNQTVLPGTGQKVNHLDLMSIAFAWPATSHVSIVGGIRHDKYLNHFQQLFYGVEYNTCCFVVRLVAGRIATGLTSSGKYQYNSHVYVQVALKGLGYVGMGNPANLLESTIGYRSALFA